MSDIKVKYWKDGKHILVESEGWDSFMENKFLNPMINWLNLHYDDIKNGQITYYTDSSTDQPFYAPVYTLSSTVDKVIRKDPMDSVKPEYIRTPITSTMNSVSRDQFTKDALSHREDIMSLQQNLYNRTKWTSKWK
jgi:hypothetical protein